MGRGELDVESPRRSFRKDWRGRGGVRSAPKLLDDEPDGCLDVACGHAHAVHAFRQNRDAEGGAGGDGLTEDHPPGRIRDAYLRHLPGQGDELHVRGGVG